MNRSSVTQGRARGQCAGFTLVELLVVIGIISLLIAILLPALNKARAAGNRTACLSNIRQLGIAIQMYCNDNGGYFPTCAFWDAPPAYGLYPDDWIHWQANRKLDDSAVAKYVGHGEQLKRVLRCPADTPEGRKTHIGIMPGQGPYLYSYNMNDALAENVRSGQVRTKITQWHQVSRKILLTEVQEIWNQAPVWDYGSPLTWRHGTGISVGNEFLSPGKKMGTNVSAVFLDAHAEPVSDDVACQTFQMHKP